MVNLFRQSATQPGGLTAALLALLEHSDRNLLNGLLRKAGIPFQAETGTDLRVRFPAPDGPPGTGLLDSPHFRLAVAAEVPGEPLDPASLAGLPGTPLTVTLTGQAPPGAHALSWEQVDRWLADAAGDYDPESRTGFLIAQFRAVLPEWGIEYFPGFDLELLEAAPAGLEALSRFFRTAGQFFDRFTPALSALRPGATQLRQARPEELLTGYSYRDYSDPAAGSGAFLRVAFHLPEQALHLIYWLTPGGPGDAHSRLRQLLLDDDGFRRGLADLEDGGLLWLWSPDQEHKTSLADLQSEDLATLDWARYHAGVQVSTPFGALPGEDLTGRVTTQVVTLLQALAPVLATTLH